MWPQSNESFSYLMAQKRIAGTFGPFTFAYPHLTAPDSEGKFADNKYKVDGVGAPDSKAMLDAVAALKDAAKKLGVKLTKDVNLPISAEKAKGEDGKKAPTGQKVLRAKSQYAPTIVDASGTPIPAKKLAKLKIGAGSEGLIQGYFGSYEMTVKERIDGELVTTTVEGISFTLTGVQLISVSAGQSGASFGAYAGGGFSIDDDDDGEGLDDDTAEDDTSADDGDDGELDI